MSLVEILSDLEQDESVSGYRGTMLAFLRLVELCAQDSEVMSLWIACEELAGRRCGQDDKSGERFAIWIFKKIWPKTAWQRREDLADEARRLAA